MWVVAALLLALSSGALCEDKLNMCMNGTHHKVDPGPEGDLYLQVTNTDGGMLGHSNGCHVAILKNCFHFNPLYCMNYYLNLIKMFSCVFIT